MAKHTDTELLDYLQSLNDNALYTGKCSLRDSSNGRGWRMHETTLDDAVIDVRQAIENYIELKDS